ncbi:hypothetical protein AOQ84DRAFT_148538 [Glonium stellatum]|uniref:Uncharacterized protein n=1 Tax=Glonium stellatum TaxID=574774 RepID=A0A8E2F8J1_9PEZI|nr:hypothetical protein AOQ84DRAFT_148538 [Glonium stellatum]
MNLRKGTFLGVGVVSLIYCCLNLMMLAMLEIESISIKELLITCFGVNRQHRISLAISLSIVLSALGNVIGVTFTNSRVIRQIAKGKLIPMYGIFQSSSVYGISAWDGNGTPSGALFLHGALCCVTILLTPVYSGFPEGLFFTTCLFFFGHSMLCTFLGIRFWSIRRSEHINQPIAIAHQRIDSLDYHDITEARILGSLELDEQIMTDDPPNAGKLVESSRPRVLTQTTVASEVQQISESSGRSRREDPREIGESSGPTRLANSEEQPLVREPLSSVSTQPSSQAQKSIWSFLRPLWTLFVVVLFTSFQLFIVVMLCVYAKNPDGMSRRTPVEFLPVVLWLVGGLGFLYGVYTVMVSWDFHFENPIDPNNPSRPVTKHRQGWKFNYPMKSITNDPRGAPSAQELQPDMVRCANRTEFPGLLHRQTWNTFWSRLNLKPDFANSEGDQSTT